MRKENLFWGAVLIAIGLILLVDRMVPYNLWARAWPLLLVAAGVWMLLVSRRAPDSLPNESLNLPLEGAQRARISLEHGLGELTVDAGDDPASLLSGDFVGGVKWRREQTHDTVHVSLRPSAERLQVYSGFWPGWLVGPRRSEGLTWHLHLNPETPLTIDAEGGLASCRYDLGDLNVKSFHLKGGLASTVVDLPVAAGHTRVRIETGLASVRVNIPEGVAARIHTSGGLSSSDIDARRFPRSNGEHASPDYAEAANTVEIEVELGLGSLCVR